MHTLASKSLKVPTWIPFLSTKKLLHFDLRNTQAHTGYSQGKVVFPSQWNCYHLSRKWQVSGTLETMESHETLGEIILWGTTHYNFHSWNWRQKVRATPGCSTSDFVNEPNFYKSVMANSERNFTHTHKPQHTNWWYSNCNLVNEFLTFYLLNSNIEQDQKSLNTRDSGAFHVFSQC
jgi:hypothetical protein